MNYWQGNTFMFPGASYARPEPQVRESVLPTAIPTPTQSVLPSVDRGLIGGERDRAPEVSQQETSALSIGDVNGGLIGNMGTIGSALGFAGPVPGLGLAANLGQRALESGAYERGLPGLGFSANVPSAMLNSMSFGLFGQSIHDQAAQAMRDKGGQNAGDTNAFGGRAVGRDTAQAQNQGRGGAAPSGPDPAMGNRGGLGGAYGGRRGDGLRG